MKKRVKTGRLAATVQNIVIKDLNRKVKLASEVNPSIMIAAHAFVDGMKDLISKGISPVKQIGRMPAYKKPESYPDRMRRKFPAKRRRPVNLLLSGEFLKDLTFIVKRDSVQKVRFGFFQQKSILKERGHREGAGGQPKRPIIPNENEQFSKNLMIRFREAILRAMAKNILQRK